jgi:hypothetical protein
MSLRKYINARPPDQLEVIQAVIRSRGPAWLFSSLFFKGPHHVRQHYFHPE